MSLLVSLLFVGGYTLLRGPRAPEERVPGVACVPVPASRVLAPGVRRVLHVYDSSSLQAVRHAQRHANSSIGQVVINATAAEMRRLSQGKCTAVVGVMAMVMITAICIIALMMFLAEFWFDEAEDSAETNETIAW